MLGPWKDLLPVGGLQTTHSLGTLLSPFVLGRVASSRATSSRRKKPPMRCLKRGARLCSTGPVVPARCELGKSANMPIPHHCFESSGANLGVAVSFLNLTPSRLLGRLGFVDMFCDVLCRHRVSKLFQTTQTPGLHLSSVEIQPLLAKSWCLPCQLLCFFEKSISSEDRSRTDSDLPAFYVVEDRPETIPE